MRLKALMVAMVLSGTLTSVYADDATDLAKKAQNPVEKMISVPIDNDFNFDYGARDNTQYELFLKPVIPFTLNNEWNLITRTIIPVAHQPNIFLARSYINGVGDITPTLFLSPAKPGVILWGAGPVFVLPTATNKQLGQGKYSIGPSVVVLTMPGNWVIGLLLYNVWSIGGSESRVSVNQMNLQYFVNYNMPKGWYLTTQPIISANWRINKSSNRWVIPLGGGFGHVFKIGKQPVNISLQAYNNIKAPVAGPQWTAEFNIQLLFPEH